MKWAIEYLDEAQGDVRRLDGSQRKQYAKAIDKVCQNPLPTNEGGYGKPLGNKGGRNLTGPLKIKLKQSGIRIVYRLIRQDDKMVIAVVGMRADEEVYDEAWERVQRYPELW